MGLAPIQRDNTEYEFDIVLDIARNHIATASKDVTFLDRFGAVITPELGRDLAKWLNSGASPAAGTACADCGKLIVNHQRMSADKIMENTVKNFGRPLCWECACEAGKQVKAHAAETVPDGAH